MEDLKIFKPDLTNRNIELRNRLFAIQMHFGYTQQELCADMDISNVTLRSFQNNRQDTHIKTLSKINRYIVKKEAEISTLPIGM
jgi:DNA-binding XRE family transcriptional regulator